MLTLVADGASDVGRVRERNEDAYAIDEDYQVFIVADGMGGHNAGDVASAEAVAEARRFLRSRLDELTAEDEEEEEAGDPDRPSERDEMRSIVRATLQKACAHVYNIAQQRPECAGMGCTMTLVAFRGARGYVGHVGDCRLWLVREGRANRLTEDHRVVAELVRKGELTEEEAKDFPFPNSLSRSVGVHPMVEVDTIDFDVLQGDRMLMCSDGLAEYVTDEDVSTLVWGPSVIDGLPERFVDLANGEGGVDNITVLCIEVRDAGKEVTKVSVDTLNMIGFILHIPVFSDFEYRELTAFLNLTETVDYQAGDEIFAQGSPCGSLEVLLYGNVQIVRDGRAIGEVGSGDPVGETAFLFGEDHSATAQAQEVCRTLRVEASPLRELLKADPRLSSKLMTGLAKVMAQRLRARR